ncbi:MAG: phosphoenolpyruvate carboxykinase (GTP) [Candidatus Eremiobacteraeota bacterium]|nr:phosphoenolpyruvate carboxykinase (GTP) [Candidatus Eremiobacteraeota bacterium]
MVTNTDMLVKKMGEKNFAKLKALENDHAIEFVAKYVELCEPDAVFFNDDSPEDVQKLRDDAIAHGEERKIGLPGQTAHNDGYYDQARDKNNTKYLLPKGVDLGPHILATEREEGHREIHEILRGIMKGATMYVRCHSLGPVNSEFSISALQITDSAYVAHSEDILYRGGYEQFKKLRGSNEFFRFIHSQGELAGAVCKNLDKRRIYMDLTNNTVYSTNTQYGGNSIGLKKLAMRLAIQKANKSDWLTEHMLIMGVHGPGGRVTYFTGAFPSACGKTSTAMLPGETIIGDDIAYIRAADGVMKTVNVEKGIFGIIQDVNAKDDPLIWKVLTTPGEAIFVNVLIDDEGTPHWLGKGTPPPQHGVNHHGEWTPGTKDKDGKTVDISNKNARYTIPLARLGNIDRMADSPEGVPVGGIIYGGRDSDTTVPVEQTFDWNHGIITKGASLESETTAATLGKEGVRLFNPMSNLEFLAVDLGTYLKNNLDFGKKLKNPPLIFGVNYFLKNKEGKYHNTMDDKRIWVKWMELRVHGDVEVIKTPTGHIPKYADLQRLFKEVLKREYTEAEYEEQFTVRIPELLAKIDRIEKEYNKEKNIPPVLFDVLEAQKKRLHEAREKKGDYIKPSQL